MGGALAAVADDPSTVPWNFAGLAGIAGPGLSASYLSLYPDLKLGLSYHLLAACLPTRFGSAGLSWIAFSSELYREDIICLAYSKRVNRALSVGGAWRLLRRSISENEYVRADPNLVGIPLSKSSASLDLGALLELKRLRVGISASNLIPPDVGFIEEEIVPPTLRMGIAWGDNPIGSFEARLRGREIGFGAGIEWRPFKSFPIRAGIGSNTLSIGWGIRKGIGSALIQIDYAFVHPLSGIKGSPGWHLLSASLVRSRR